MHAPSEKPYCKIKYRTGRRPAPCWEEALRVMALAASWASNLKATAFSKKGKIMPYPFPKKGECGALYFSPKKKDRALSCSQEGESGALSFSQLEIWEPYTLVFHPFFSENTRKDTEPKKGNHRDTCRMTRKPRPGSVLGRNVPMNPPFYEAPFGNQLPSFSDLSPPSAAAPPPKKVLETIIPPFSNIITTTITQTNECFPPRGP